MKQWLKFMTFFVAFSGGIPIITVYFECVFEKITVVLGYLTN